MFLALGFSNQTAEIVAEEDSEEEEEMVEVEDSEIILQAEKIKALFNFKDENFVKSFLAF